MARETRASNFDNLILVPVTMSDELRFGGKCTHEVVEDYSMELIDANTSFLAKKYMRAYRKSNKSRAYTYAIS